MNSIEMEADNPHRFDEGNHFLDRAHLIRICQGDDIKARELAAYAIPVIERSLARLRKCRDQSDDPSLLSELQRLMGSVGIIEPAVAYFTVRKLEADYALLNTNDRTSRFENLVCEMQILCGELERYIG